MIHTSEQKLSFLEQSVTTKWSSTIDALETWHTVEEPNWAPWLAASQQTIEGRGNVFPEGQLVLKGPDGKVHALLSMNQVQWDGDIAHLPNWDSVAGDPTDYSTTYDPKGNTLVLMSMSIDPQLKGLKVPSQMIDYAKCVAHTLEITHLIGSFRPSGFGQAKKESGYHLDFDSYIHMQQVDGKPVDPWLRSLSWKGMQIMSIDPKAMTVIVPKAEFAGYKASYKPEHWAEVAQNIWECLEVGAWNVDPVTGIATYQESNVWGSLPLGK